MGPIFSRVRRLARGMALIPIALAIGAISASAAPIMITFDNDTPENNPDLLASGLIMGNYFTSVDSSQVHFVDTDILNPAGFEMFIQNESYTNDSNALGVGVDYDNSALRILLDVPATSISMDFFYNGNDFLPQFGDMAVLTVFLDDVPYDPVEILLFDPPNPRPQSISFDGATFDKAEFQFVVSRPRGLAELVDNVEVNPIPEPRAAIAFGAGVLLVGAAIRRRSRAEAGR